MRWTGGHLQTLGTVTFLALPLVAWDIVRERCGTADLPLRWSAPLRILFYAALLALLALFGSRGGAAFIYFQF